MNPTICFFLIDSRMLKLRHLGHFTQAFPLEPQRLTQMFLSRCMRALRLFGGFHYNPTLCDQISSEYSV